MQSPENVLLFDNVRADRVGRIFRAGRVLGIPLLLAACSSGITASGNVNGTPFSVSAGPAGGSSSPSEGTTAGSPSAPASAPESSAPDTSTPESGDSSTSGYPETAEWRAPVFDKLTAGAVILNHTIAGNTYTVICRIPPNDGQPASVRDGGWYEVEDPAGPNGLGFVAANTFNNGQLPNQNPYDPAITTFC